MNQSLLSPYQRQAVIWIVIAAVAGSFLWLLSPVLMPFLLGGMFAYILQPGVSWIAKHSVPRSLAALFMMLLLIFLLLFLVLMLLVVVQKEGAEIRNQIPELILKLQNGLAPRLAEYGFKINFDFASLTQFVSSQLSDSTEAVINALMRSIKTSGNFAIIFISNVVMVPLVIYYLLYDWHAILGRIRGFIPRRWLGKTLALTKEMDRMLSQYLRGQVLVMGILAMYYSLTLWAAGFDIAIPIGIFTGLAVFVPYIGFGTGLILALLAALLQFNNIYGYGIVAAIYGIGQVFETVYLTPRLVGERIGMHPLAVIFALLAFGQLFGFFGVLLAFPASAIVMTGLQELRLSYLRSTLYKN